MQLVILIEHFLVHNGILVPQYDFPEHYYFDLSCPETLRTKRLLQRDKGV